jgi:polyhydroxyalkanoate synthase
MHSFYLRNMYMHNRLVQPGAITLDGVPIDLTQVRVPTYFVSAMEDHIAPWKATYRGPFAMKGDSRFVLSGSGHIAGMINPPPGKYPHWVNDARPDDPEDWLKDATQREGSWWSDWDQWLESFKGKPVAARVPGKGKLKVLGDAPGSYVRITADAK